MKLPRWLVIAMLTTSVLSVLAAAGWWWVTWPERTAREFVNLLSEDRWEQANELLSNSEAWLKQPRESVVWECQHCSEYFVFSKPTASDLLLARRTIYAGLWNEWILTAQFSRIQARLVEDRRDGMGKIMFQEVDPELSTDP